MNNVGIRCLIFNLHQKAFKKMGLEKNVCLLLELLCFNYLIIIIFYFLGYIFA